MKLTSLGWVNQADISDSSKIRTHNHLVYKWTLNPGLENWSKRVNVFAYTLEHLGVCHIQDKHYKKWKKYKDCKSTSKSKDENLSKSKP